VSTPELPRRVPEAAIVGKKAAFSRTFTEADVALFVGVTWDVNPYHTSDRYVRSTRFQRRIVPGLLTGSMLTHVGGLWAFLATGMSFEFIAPVHIGETITAEVEVVEADASRNWARLRCSCTNEAGVEVLRAEVVGYPGRFKE